MLYFTALVKTITKVKPTNKRPPPRGSKMLPVKNTRKLPQRSGKMSGKIAPRKIGEAHKKVIMRRNARITRVRRKGNCSCV